MKEEGSSEEVGPCGIPTLSVGTSKGPGRAVAVSVTVWLNSWKLIIVLLSIDLLQFDMRNRNHLLWFGKSYDGSSQDRNVAKEVDNTDCDTSTMSA